MHHRSRRPPHNQTNALLSFGYTILWQHLQYAIESHGLDAYCGNLHQDNGRHPALVSDLIEEFRAPLVDALGLTLIHRHEIDAERDFQFRDGGCFLTPAGIKIYLNAFTARMNQEITSDDGTLHPRWHVIQQQIHAYKQFIYQPTQTYQPYRIR
jgi:CRISP-associated protein Cas1